MSSIIRFNSFRAAMKNARTWAGLHGKPYRGGGGGIGSLHALSVEATIYHQASDGATNYHEAPDIVCRALADEIKARFRELLTAAMARLEAEQAALAGEAVKEHAELMRAAGLATPAECGEGRE